MLVADVDRIPCSELNARIDDQTRWRDPRHAARRPRAVFSVFWLPVVDRQPNTLVLHLVSGMVGCSDLEEHPDHAAARLPLPGCCAAAFRHAPFAVGVCVAPTRRFVYDREARGGQCLRLARRAAVDGGEVAARNRGRRCGGRLRRERGGRRGRRGRRRQHRADVRGVGGAVLAGALEAGGARAGPKRGFGVVAFAVAEVEAHDPQVRAASVIWPRGDRTNLNRRIDGWSRGGGYPRHVVSRRDGVVVHGWLCGAVDDECHRLRRVAVSCVGGLDLEDHAGHSAQLGRVGKGGRSPGGRGAGLSHAPLIVVAVGAVNGGLCQREDVVDRQVEARRLLVRAAVDGHEVAAHDWRW